MRIWIVMLVSLFFCSFTFAEVSVEPEDILLKVKIEKQKKVSVLRVTYTLNQYVKSVDFSATPFRFIKGYWSAEASNGTFNYQTLSLEFNAPQKSFDIMIKGIDSSFYRGFYTPFIELNDEQFAFFVGHYLPKRFVSINRVIPRDEMKVSISIVDQSERGVYFTHQSKTISSEEAQKYAIIGNPKISRKKTFDLLISPKTPRWLQKQYSEYIPKLMEFYESNFGEKLNFRPLIFIGFDNRNTSPRSDGGAINQQVALNIIGEGWHQQNETNRTSLVSLLSHEIAHLWNAQHWETSSNSPWLVEGSAEFFAHYSLLKLGFLTKEKFIERLNNYRKQCEHDLSNAAIPDMHKVGMRHSVYACGFSLFESASNSLANDPFVFWGMLVNKSQNKGYTAQDFIDLTNLSEDKLFKESVEVLLTPHEAKRIKAFIDLKNKE